MVLQHLKDLEPPLKLLRDSAVFNVFNSPCDEGRETWVRLFLSCEI